MSNTALDQFDPGSLTSSPLQMDASVELGAPVADIFEVIVDFPNMPSWMPLMKKVDVDNSDADVPGEVGSVRVIYPPVGKAALEKVKAFERPWLLSYGASDESLMGMFTDHTGILTCRDNGRGGTTLRWQTYAVPGKNPLMRMMGNKVFPFVVNTSMKKLKKRFPCE